MTIEAVLPLVNSGVRFRSKPSAILWFLTFPVQKSVVSTLIAFVQTLAASPLSAAGFVGGLVVLTCMAIWILYRNLIVMNTSSGRYAYL